MRCNLKQFLYILSLISLSTFSLRAEETVSILYYNLLNFPDTNESRIANLATIFPYYEPDLILANELSSSSGAGKILDEALNINGVFHYQQAKFVDGPDTDNMLFYNSRKFTLLNQEEIATPIRDINHYQLYANTEELENGDTVFFNCFSAHLKAADGSQNEQKRLEEVKVFKAYLEANDLDNIIFGGDFNFYTSDEPGYQYLLDSGSVKLFDPINTAGIWADNPAFAAVHTQSPRSISIDGGAGSGLDSRFDFIVTSDDVLNNLNGVDYQENSYVVLGNDGNHFNKSILDEPANTFAPADILQALHDMSDHLPVMASFNLTGNFPTEQIPEGIIINEVLFNPYSKGVDFVEIYNNSSSTVNLKNWQIISYNSGDGTIRGTETISDSLLNFLPHNYLVLTESIKNTTRYYPNAVITRFVEVDNLPTFSNDEGTIILLNSSHSIVEQFSYNEDMHAAILSDNEGVSLERIDFDAATQLKSNWASAAKSENFATPGYQNSQNSLTAVSKAVVRMEDQSFTPNGDGIKDIVELEFSTPKGGSIGNVAVYDERGNWIITIAKNQLLGTTGTFFWDGKNASGALSPQGMYIIYLEFFDEQGNVERFKKVVILQR